MRYVFMAILLCGTAFGGTCPSGSNYVGLTSPGTGGNAGSVTLASLGALQCYFVSATGLDSNTEAAETHPWLHSPGMTSATGNAASHTDHRGRFLRT